MPLLVLGLIAVVDFPVCPMRVGIGIPCPGCGLTRATVAMARLDFHGMLHFHPLAPILTPLVVWSFAKPVLLALGWIKQAWVDRIPRPPQFIWVALGVAMIGLWMARLFGLLGGSPDRVDFTQGLFYRGLHALYLIVGG
jgi:hypothetical protein